MCNLDNKGHAQEYSIFTGQSERISNYTGRTGYALSSQSIDPARVSMYSRRIYN